MAAVWLDYMLRSHAVGAADKLNVLFLPGIITKYGHGEARRCWCENLSHSGKPRSLNNQAHTGYQ